MQQSWIEKYVSYVSGASESPDQYHWWAAATIISATLKRNIWVDRKLWKLYPNLYTVLVGKPGLGKGAAVNPAAELLREANTTNMLSDRLTIEYVLEKLSKGFTNSRPSANGSITIGTDSSAVIFAPEMSIFITASASTLPILSDLWDGRDGSFEYGTRGKGCYRIESPNVCFLGCSAEKWLMKSIPNDAVGGGFTRRVNFVFADKKSKLIPWPMSSNSTDIRSNLIDTLRGMSMLHGEVKFASDAEAVFEKYYLSAVPDEFCDEATAAYITTKWAHATKLAMILTASDGGDLIIKKNTIERAIEMVEDLAKTLKFVFRGVGESDLVQAADRVLRYIEGKGYASRRDIIRANWQHISAAELDIVLMTLRDGGMIDEVSRGNMLIYKAK